MGSAGEGPGHKEICDEVRNSARLTNTAVENGATFEDRDAQWVEKLKDGMTIDIKSMTETQMVFDIIGIDTPIANAFRRIMIAEVPTMAVEKVFMINNTSVIQDEVLAHRLGLVPIYAEPSAFIHKGENADNEENNLVFTLNAKCERVPGVADDAPDSYRSVMSSALKWVPQGNQAEKFAADPPRPVNDDILLARLGPGQEISVRCHAEKGVGQVHAKWSPVCTASYRILPNPVIPEPITGDDATKIANMCPLQVFDIEDMGSNPKLRVANGRKCTMCRECIRLDEYEKSITLLRKKDHFIFSIESTGVYHPKEIFRLAVEIMKEKAEKVLSLVEGQ